jgi:AAA domain
MLIPWCNYFYDDSNIMATLWLYGFRLNIYAGKTSTIWGIISTLLSRQPFSGSGRAEGSSSDHPEDHLLIAGNGSSSNGIGSDASTVVRPLDGSLVGGSRWGASSSGHTEAHLTGRHYADAARKTQRLLICTPSNAAVDEILSRLMNGILDQDGNIRRVRLLRLGEPLEGASEAIRALSLDFQAERLLEQDSAFAKVGEIKAAIAELQDRLHVLERGSGGGQQHETSMRDVKAKLGSQTKARTWALQALEKARTRIRHQLLSSAEVVASTLSGAGKQQFIDHITRDDIRFETVIIDEAAQTSEPAALIPLRSVDPHINFYTSLYAHLCLAHGFTLLYRV